ncbi:hypothetical protein, partial [Flavobacterium sp. T12S277]|uniref:hypothetical protein n=1 Tax=Flavobacterium sp. T12S277 TaxID=3402752 RepID=UPI003AD9A925
NIVFNQNGGGHFAPELGGHFELESGAHFKTEWGDQYNRNLHSVPYVFFIVNFLALCDLHIL